MNRKNEFITFFVALAVIGVIVVGGIAYFKVQSAPDSFLLAATSTPQTLAVETIPTSTIITTISTSTLSISPLSLPYYYKASTSNEAYWPKAWGDVLFTNTSLALVPDPTTHGANSFLNGASSWANYAVNVDASWLMGGWFDIVTRVSNNTQNFAYCEFGPNGTEIVERVNGADTQLASTAVAPPDIAGANENFGMEVYGNDIACEIAGQEVVGVHVQNNNVSHTGGIGFVIFGQPQNQKQVTITKISVSKMSQDTIAVPFPVIVVTPPQTGIPTPPPPPAPTPAQASSTQEQRLPYSIGTFNNGFNGNDGWSNWWGNSAEENGVLMIGATASTTGGGALLQGSSAWTNYTFQATVNWSQGETFGIIARYISDQDYLVCEFDEKNVGDMNIKLDQHLNGVVTHLADGDILNYDEMGGANILVAIQVNGNQGTCGFNGSTVSTVISSDSIDPALSHGEIGFTTWDPTMNNSQIVVTKVGVADLIYSLGTHVPPISP